MSSMSSPAKPRTLSLSSNSVGSNSPGRKSTNSAGTSTGNSGTTTTSARNRLFPTASTNEVERCAYRRDHSLKHHHHHSSTRTTSSTSTTDLAHHQQRQPHHTTGYHSQCSPATAAVGGGASHYHQHQQQQQQQQQQHHQQPPQFVSSSPSKRSPRKAVDPPTAVVGPRKVEPAGGGSPNTQARSSATVRRSETYGGTLPRTRVILRSSPTMETQPAEWPTTGSPNANRRSTHAFNTQGGGGLYSVASTADRVDHNEHSADHEQMSYGRSAFIHQANLLRAAVSSVGRHSASPTVPGHQAPTVTSMKRAVSAGVNAQLMATLPSTESVSTSALNGLNSNNNNNNNSQPTPSAAVAVVKSETVCENADGKNSNTTGGAAQTQITKTRQSLAVTPQPLRAISEDGTTVAAMASSTGASDSVGSMNCANDASVRSSPHSVRAGSSGRTVMLEHRVAQLEAMVASSVATIPTTSVTIPINSAAGSMMPGTMSPLMRSSLSCPRIQYTTQLTPLMYQSAALTFTAPPQQLQQQNALQQELLEKDLELDRLRFQVSKLSCRQEMRQMQCEEEIKRYKMDTEQCRQQLSALKTRLEEVESECVLWKERSSNADRRRVEMEEQLNCSEKRLMALRSEDEHKCKQTIDQYEKVKREKEWLELQIEALNTSLDIREQEVEDMRHSQRQSTEALSTMSMMSTSMYGPTTSTPLRPFGQKSISMDFVNLEETLPGRSRCTGIDGLLVAQRNSVSNCRRTTKCLLDVATNMRKGSMPNFDKLLGCPIESMSESEPECSGAGGGSVEVRLKRQNVQLEELEKNLEKLRELVVALYARKTAADMTDKSCRIQ